MCKEPPDLIVEVVSPSTRERDLGVKVHLYARFGVKEYWVVDPDTETLTAYRLEPAGYQPQVPFCGGDTLVRPHFPNIPLRIAEVFLP